MANDPELEKWQQNRDAAQTKLTQLDAELYAEIQLANGSQETKDKLIQHYKRHIHKERATIQRQITKWQNLTNKQRKEKGPEGEAGGLGQAGTDPETL